MKKRAGFLRFALGHLLQSTDPLLQRWEHCVSPQGTYFVAGLGLSFWTAILAALDPEQFPDWTPELQEGLRRLRLFRPGRQEKISEQYRRIQAGMEYLRTLAPELRLEQWTQFVEQVARMQNREWADASEPNTAIAERIETALRWVRNHYPLRKRLKEFTGSPTPAVALSELARGALHQLDDSFDPDCSTTDADTIRDESLQYLQDRFRVHPLETPALLDWLGSESQQAESTSSFHGFCRDTFVFLAELAENNRKEWMEIHRERYRYSLKDPMVELCDQLLVRYVQPMLLREMAWELEVEPRPGKAITHIQKNDYGQTVPYQTEMAITFHRRQFGNRQMDVQFTVQVDRNGLFWGFHLGKKAREAGKQFRRLIQEQADALLYYLHRNNALRDCSFFWDDPQNRFPLQDAVGLRRWAMEKDLRAGRWLPADATLLRSEDLVNEIIMTFNTLLPLFIAAMEPEPLQALENRYGKRDDQPLFDTRTFETATHLNGQWLERTYGLLKLKRQIILQGVPGTGKTHVARNLAQWLTHNQDNAIRLVQFHPAYSYEEFVEGIKARSIEVQGRNEVTYPIEPGVLCQFAAEAEANPEQNFVLIIDEINRGNLPRIFGELLYLLEYRDQSITLPYSRKMFRLPKNLFVIGTMNLADRSVAMIDQALRRRFSFVDMLPRVDILRSWFQKNSPLWSQEELKDFLLAYEHLNKRLCADLGPSCQIGHSYLMIPELDAAKWAVIWEHHIHPLLEEFFAGQPQRLASYSLSAFWSKPERRNSARED